MRSPSALAGALVAVASVASARPGATSKRPPGRPTVPLVRVTVAVDHVLVTEDVRLPRVGWNGADVDLFVAFGAPGTPRAVDARVYPGTEDEPLADAAFEVASVARATRCPPGSALLLGPAAMAGVVIHVKAAAFAHASETTGAVRLRIRSLLDLPARDGAGEADVVVRLGAYDGEPDALESVDVVSEPPHLIDGAEAMLVGEGHDRLPLALSRSPLNRGRLDVVAPLASVRHANDDLVVRFRLRATRPG